MIPKSLQFSAISNPSAHLFRDLYIKITAPWDLCILKCEGRDLKLHGSWIAADLFPFSCKGWDVCVIAWSNRYWQSWATWTLLCRSHWWADKPLTVHNWNELGFPVRELNNWFAGAPIGPSRPVATASSFRIAFPCAESDWNGGEIVWLSLRGEQSLVW